MLRNLDGNERLYPTYVTDKVGEKLLKENTGSDKGKLVPTDIGTIVTDFLVKKFWKHSRLQFHG
jgi:DNA topoisomerase-1